MNLIGKLGKKKTAILLVGCLAAVVVILVLGLSLPSGEQGRHESSVMAEIPDADLDEQPDGKADSYRRGGADAYWQSLEEDILPGEDAGGQAPDLSQTARTERPSSMTVDDMFGDMASEEIPQMEEPSRPAARPQRSGGSSGGGRSAPVKKESPAQPSRSSVLDEEYPKEEPYVEPKPQVKRSGAVSSLDEDVRVSLGNGFSSLDGSEQWISGDEKKPYRCMFMRDEKVKSGQRITVRLLEDLVAGGVHIPANTHLQGVCTISDRMEIAVTSLDMGGRILSFSYEAVDTDGGRGIYCSELSQTRKDVTEQGLATITSGLNSRLGRAARDAAAVGASIVRTKTGEATVSVPAGYMFYLVEKKKY